MEEREVKSAYGKCSACGGNLEFCPSTQDLICVKCEHHYEIVNSAKVIAHDLLDAEIEGNPKDNEFALQNNTFKCSNCGAKVFLDKLELSKVCPYCGTALVIDNSMIGTMPDAVIPFAFDEQEAAEKFATCVRKRFFAPRKFKRNMPENKIKGVYIPAFAFDTKTESVYDGQLYEDEDETDSEGHTHTNRHYFHISGRHRRNFNDVIVECSSKITQNEIDGVLPYDYDGKKSYKNEYILGYSVERYNKSVKDSIPTYKQIVEHSIRNQILSKYHYDGVSYLNVKTDYLDEKYRYYILPMYRFDYEYKRKKYVTYMNGQTGRVDNNIPKSGWKIFFTIILPIILVVGIVVLISILSGN